MAVPKASAPRPGRAVPHVGLVLDGHVDDPETVVADVDRWLVDKLAGDKWRRYDTRRKARNARICRAWWGGEALGFVGSDHPSAVPVTVVDLIDDDLLAEPTGGQ